MRTLFLQRTKFSTVKTADLLHAPYLKQGGWTEAPILKKLPSTFGKRFVKRMPLHIRVRRIWKALRYIPDGLLPRLDAWRKSKHLRIQPLRFTSRKIYDCKFSDTNYDNITSIMLEVIFFIFEKPFLKGASHTRRCVSLTTQVREVYSVGQLYLPRQASVPQRVTTLSSGDESDSSFSEADYVRWMASRDFK